MTHSEISQTSTGAFVNPFQYTGRDYDPETGLRYYRARYYDAITGRFLNEDPVGFSGGMNFYTYSSNSPATINDPTGEKVHIDQSGDTITVSASIVTYGPRSSDALAQQWQNGINNYWNNFGINFHYGKCKVVFKVSVFNKPGINWWWSLPSGVDNWVYVPDVEHYRSNVEMGYWGYWAFDLNAWGSAHEFGHFAGLSDYYDYDSAGHLVPDATRGKEIMSIPDGPIVQKDIDDILARVSVPANRSMLQRRIYQ